MSIFLTGHHLESRRRCVELPIEVSFIRDMAFVRPSHLVPMAVGEKILKKSSKVTCTMVLRRLSTSSTRNNIVRNVVGAQMIIICMIDAALPCRSREHQVPQAPYFLRSATKRTACGTC